MSSNIGLEPVRTHGRAAAREQEYHLAGTITYLWQRLTPDEETAVRLVLSRLPTLSEKEWELVHLLCQAQSNTAVANHYVLSRRTIENYITQLFQRLGLPHKAEGVLNRKLILYKAYEIYQLEGGGA